MAQTMLMKILLLTVGTAMSLFSTSSSAVGILPSLSPKNPEVSSSGSLVGDSEAATALAEMVDTYVSQRRERLEEHILVPVLQDDLDKWYEFTMEHSETEPGLTSKLLLGLVVLQDAQRSEAPTAVGILRDIASDYPDRWQGSFADYLATTADLELADVDRASRKYLEAERECLASLVKIAHEMDDSADPALWAIRRLYLRRDGVTFASAYTEELRRVNDELGNQFEPAVRGESTVSVVPAAESQTTDMEEQQELTVETEGTFDGSSGKEAASPLGGGERATHSNVELRLVVVALLGVCVCGVLALRLYARHKGIK